MIGALPWDPPAERPGWLGEIDRPIVLVTTSSEYQADWAHGEAGEALVRAALDGLRDEPFEVVATMPAGIQGLGTLPANARVLDFVPHRHVLDRTVVAVTHGGMGATQKALARGIPVCVVPFGRDQLEVAARTVQADAGTRVSAKRLTGTPPRRRPRGRDQARRSRPGRRRLRGRRRRTRRGRRDGGSPHPRPTLTSASRPARYARSAGFALSSTAVRYASAASATRPARRSRSARAAWYAW